MELPELPELEREERKDKLNNVVAITVTLLVAFMAVCRLFDNNIVLTMQQVQISRLDHWNWYQSLTVREDINQARLTDIHDEEAAGTSEKQQKGDALRVQDYQKIADKLKAKKEKIKAQAEEEEARYEKLDQRHENFDQTEALISIAVSMLALTSLLQKRWMLLVALAPGIFGVVKGATALIEQFHFH
jgi:hypothetical protein